MRGLQAGDAHRIGPYRLMGELGSGGMGRVFLGRSAGGRPVAVKVIRADLAADPEFRVRFAREVAAARRVNGLFTAQVVDADVAGPVPWLATVYIAGPSLAQAVAGHGPLPAPSVLALAAGLAESLGAIHAAGVVHRDLKPSNVLLAGDGPRVIDFGISRAAEAASLTRSGTVVGSPGFMSPEQAEGREVGPPSDIFSLGALLVFAATGQAPFGDGPTAALVYRVVHGSPDLDQLPTELRPLIERCLAKDAGKRPTADDLLAEAGATHPASDWLPEPMARAFGLEAAAEAAAHVPTGNHQIPAATVTSSTVTARKAPQPLVLAAGQPQPGSGRSRRRSWRRPIGIWTIGGLVAAFAAVIVIVIATTQHQPPAPPPGRLVSITLSPTTPASGEVLAVAARLLGQRAAHLHLQHTDARVSGRTVVLTGPAADEAQLKTLAAAGVLSMRQVLLHAPAGTVSGTASGHASAVNTGTLVLFSRLVCTPGDTAQWKSQVGYAGMKSYDNPDAQVVACGSNGSGQWGKYVLDVAEIQGAWVTSATAVPSTLPSHWQVNLTLNKAGTSALSVLTSHLHSRYYPGAQAGKQDDAVLDQVAISLDGNVVTAPQIANPITDGNAQITGNFTRDYAQELSAQLQTGPLPADFRISAIRTFTLSASSQARAS
jgi:protein kinase-like protein/SecD-like export protein